ncbi:MAG: hypothetical protein QNJ62_11660 [Methyloceanibacter sp.]|nr:hypothetical protein [Methyloceanibacter sp.]
MRDIRGDLQDRASFLEEQISAAHAQFEKRMELFTREHESKIADLQAELDAVSTLMEREYRRIMTAPELEEERWANQPAFEQGPVDAAPETYPAALNDSEYYEEELEALPEEEPRDEPVAAESAPAREAEPAEEARPARREAQPRYAPRAVARDDDDRLRPAQAEARPRRPIPSEQPSVERPAAERPGAERRPPEPAPFRPVGRAPEPRQEPPRQEPPRQELPLQEPPRQEPPRREPVRQEMPRRGDEPRRYEPAQRDRGASQRPPLADFLIRKLGEVGNMSLDDLCSVAIREGYFAEGDNPVRTVQMTLMNVVKAGFIRQMQNGTFAPASVMDTIRLRRAI